MYVYLFYIFFFIISIILLLFYNFAFHKDVDKYKIKSITSDELNTGDIILIDFQNINNFFITTLFKENFMHPAIILKEEEDTYVLDYIAHKGLLKRTLAEWLAYNNKSIFTINKLSCSQENREKLANNLENLYQFYKPKLSGPSGFSWSWRRFWWPKKEYYKPYNFRSMVCLELVVYFLMEAGVVNKNRSVESFLPRDFENMKGFSFNDNFSFKDTYLVNSLFF